MAQQDSFRKIYSTKPLNIKNPAKNLAPVRPPLFYRCKMTRTEQFIDTGLICWNKKKPADFFILCCYVWCKNNIAPYNYQLSGAYVKKKKITLDISQK